MRALQLVKARVALERTSDFNLGKLYAEDGIWLQHALDGLVKLTKPVQCGLTGYVNIRDAILVRSATRFDFNVIIEYHDEPVFELTPHMLENDLIFSIGVRNLNYTGTRVFDYKNVPKTLKDAEWQVAVRKAFENAINKYRKLVLL
jgi:hypothetical protein